ncbi:MAG: 50S ribosomal protein L10 [Candidatus Doudnabacteria bacterium RIFCSPHIGHO2_01_FULL_50_11]|uniref:Large ribosomal subunit protein uL10 n=1 Tax=Candidatus Doudnabacteria bacterium RIFCSPHIGHO2_01_FULL_50_11 TaxID=1817828 RepID=A0A1F5PG71_9BACT|nr:MAG: 50S ribosomal protein L10 [Candidatus Doudnabacteria bacterium RIFCSPHIGHO2_01_FULL_50_11]HLC45013.1 50S ribosomal protein L10 [Patescibacteria group bacterium]
MPKTRAQKIDIVQTLAENFKKARGIVLSEIRGLTMSETDKLRKQLRDGGIKHQVVKISLLKLALRKAGFPTKEVKLATQVAVSYSEDETAAARELRKFGKTNEKLKFLGGFLENKFIDQAQVTALAAIPSRVDLLGQFVSVLQGPSRGLVTVLSGSHRGLVQVLSQIKK